MARRWTGTDSGAYTSRATSRGALRTLCRRTSSSFAEPTGAEGILSLINTVVDDAYLESAGPQLEVVANYGVGVNNVDLEAAQRRGIVIANTPDVLTRTTAELAIAVTLALLRRVVEGDRFIRSRAPWTFSLEFMLGEGLDGKTFGIVGAGRIGRETARLAEAFGARPLFAGRDDPLERAARERRRRQSPLPAHPGHAPSDRRARARDDEADGGAGQHRPRTDRGRARARRCPPRGSHRRRCTGRVRVRAESQRRAARAGPGRTHPAHGQRHTAARGRRWGCSPSTPCGACCSTTRDRRTPWS